MFAFGTLRFQNTERYDIQRPLVRGLKMYLGCASLVMGLQKAPCTQAPAIPGFEPGKIEFGAWGAEVIADIFGIGQKFGRHDRADCMATLILGASITGPVPEETGQWIA